MLEVAWGQDLLWGALVQQWRGPEIGQEGLGRGSSGSAKTMEDLL